MTQEEKDALVEKMARHLYQSKKWDDPKEGPGEKMKEVWRDISLHLPHSRRFPRRTGAKIDGR